jgi:hypothetical protein
MISREMARLRIPVAQIGTPAVHEYECRSSAAFHGVIQNRPVVGF